MSAFGISSVISASHSMREPAGPLAHQCDRPSGRCSTDSKMLHEAGEILEVAPVAVQLLAGLVDGHGVRHEDRFLAFARRAAAANADPEQLEQRVVAGIGLVQQRRADRRGKGEAEPAAREAPGDQTRAADGVGDPIRDGGVEAGRAIGGERLVHAVLLS
jgi:hypothetical protein